MTPTPWAQAVEAFKTYAPCCECGMCVSDGLRAALPHLLRAVVEGVATPDLDRLAESMRTYLLAANVYPAGYDAVRGQIISALTDAAGRVDAVTHDPHIEDS